VEVARILNSSFKAQTFFSAIGCGISIGTTLGVGGLDQAFNQKNWYGSTVASAGCVLMFFDTPPVFNVALDVVNLGECAAAFVETVDIEDEYFKDPTPENNRKVTASLINTIGGCVFTYLNFAADLAEL
jgi:hypothetical protein